MAARYCRCPLCQTLNHGCLGQSYRFPRLRILSRAAGTRGWLVCLKERVKAGVERQLEGETGMCGVDRDRVRRSNIAWLKPSSQLADGYSDVQGSISAACRAESCL